MDFIYAVIYCVGSRLDRTVHACSVYTFNLTLSLLSLYISACLCTQLDSFHRAKLTQVLTLSSEFQRLINGLSLLFACYCVFVWVWNITCTQIAKKTPKIRKWKPKTNKQINCKSFEFNSDCTRNVNNKNRAKALLGKILKTEKKKKP